VPLPLNEPEVLPADAIVKVPPVVTPPDTPAAPLWMWAAVEFPVKFENPPVSDHELFPELKVSEALPVPEVVTAGTSLAPLRVVVKIVVCAWESVIEITLSKQIARKRRSELMRIRGWGG